jgi:sortase A
MDIPAIESEWIVNAGSDSQTLKQGPGYIIGTSLPGQPGRCAIAGHRTTYGAPFNRVDELKRGDIIYLETLDGKEFEYIVKQQLVVDPEDIYVLEGDQIPELLLTTCTPKYSASKRLIIIAELLDYYKLESYYN